jgi:type I restriction enzyme S subunit
VKRADWKTVPIKELYEGLYDGPHATPKPSNAGPVFLGIKNVTDDGRLDLTDIRHIAEDDFLTWTRRVEPQPGDLVFTYEATLNRYAIIPEGFRGCLGRRMALIRPDNTKLDVRFLLYYFFTSEWRAVIANKMMSGATVDRIPLITFPGFPVHVPPLPVQRRIAGILSAYDELMENGQRRIRILEAMVRVLYREWFVHFRFPGSRAEAGAKADGHEKLPRATSPFGDIPVGWAVKSIQQFGVVITGKTPSKANPDFYGDDMPFVKTPDMHGNMFILGTSDCLSTAGAESQANKTLHAGSICVSCIGTIGVVSITTEDCQTNQQINSVVLANPASREFLYVRLQDAKQTLENLGANGATMGNVNKGKFEAMEIVCPPDDLLAHYHRLIEPMFSEILSLFRQIQNLRRTRDLLLPRLLSGQVELKAEEAIA